MSGEAASRARMDLPGRQAELAAAVLATGKPVVVLLFSGRPLAMPEVFAGAAARRRLLVPRQRGRPAVAALLTGAVAPSARSRRSPGRARSGRSRSAFPRAPAAGPENPTDKYTSKYLDLPDSPQFPFGHGLAYTGFRHRPTRRWPSPAHRRRDHVPIPAREPARPPPSSSSGIRSRASPARCSS